MSNFPCKITEADLDANIVTLQMEGNYTVSAGQKYLCDAPPVSAEPVDWQAVEGRISEFVGEYEMFGEDEQGRDGCYIPNESERALISDAINGLLDDDELIALLRRAAPVAAQPDVTQQTLDDVKAGIPARDAEIEALRKENLSLLYQAAVDTEVASRLARRLFEISAVISPDTPIAQHDISDLLARVKKVVSTLAQQVDRSPEMQGQLVDESLNLQSQQPVSGADGLDERAAYEEYALKNWCSPDDLERGRLTGYRLAELNQMWVGWQARATLAQPTATLASIEAFVACDASAISYLSLGEYRTALLKMLREGAQT